MVKLLSDAIKEMYDKYVEKESLLPIKISDFYMKKVVKEIETIGTGGPLYLSVVPTLDKFNVFTSVETRDYVEEFKHMPISGVDYIIQKYEDRVLVIITEMCFSHCQYCFRTYNLSNYQKSNLKENIQRKILVLKEYLRKNTNIREVILSGGDPLSIGYENMDYVLSELKQWNIRIHTRAIIYSPFAIDTRMIKLFSEYRIRLIFHINHPYEICDVVKKKIFELNEKGIRLYAQFPLLRGINDNSIVLLELLTLMDELHIRPLSIFIPDPISYSASFRIGFDRILSIMDELNWSTPSWVNSVRFVMDTTHGKVRRENIVARDGKCITFCRNGKYIDYYDLDDGIDIPSDIKILLWKSKKAKF
ncbi:radical SAM protein [bacterium D16-51]|nr:radical SAM protein [bacterium D16-59]RKI55919.1 radical SAM protein [bacterium D16-51]